jgi:hypothetical protein
MEEELPSFNSGTTVILMEEELPSFNSSATGDINGRGTTIV